MTTTQKIQLDFNLQGTTPRIRAVQGDLYTRLVEISLYSHKTPWEIPEGTTVLIRYRKPDRTVGFYDTLPNGDTAYQLQGNSVTIAIAPDALLLSGDVSVIVSLIHGEQVLSAFEILLEVQPNHGTGTPSEGAGSCISGMLPGPKNAQAGQILAVEAVTPSGAVRNLKAIDLPYYNSVQSIAPDEDTSGADETVYRVTMSDGAQHTFAVKNGRDGADGKIGADGKSAYAYAQEAGYTKSEQAFAEKLADETPPALYITIDYDMSQQETTENSITMPIAASATFGEIQAAVQEGRSVYGVSLLGVLSFTGIDAANSQALFQLIAIQAPLGLIIANAMIGPDGTGTVTALIIPDRLPSPGTLSIGSKSYDGSESVEVTSEINSMIRGQIPTALKNPYALQFTGAVSDSYDGSSAKTINIPAQLSIPDALKNPNKLILTGAVSAEYDGSAAVTVEIPAGGNYEPETEMVLSDNLLDKSLMTKGFLFYYGGSGYQMAGSEASYTYHGFIPLRGAGTYRTKFQQQVHESTGTRIALVNDDNTWVANATGTCGEMVEDKNWVDFEFIVTQEHIAAGATKVAFDVYSLFFDQTMIVKDREYPSEYIPYGYIEVATDSGKKQNNVLCEKTALFLGDSICAGTTVGTDSPYYNYGWAGLIGEANRMNWFNFGKNGGTITHRGADGTCISKIADTAIAEHPNADYVIFEGGCNDADQMKDAGLGEISSDYATFDATTFSGALESLILKLVTAYPNARIGYIIPQKMYTGYSDFTAENHIHRKYFDRAVEICRKWGIPVIDIWNTTPLNPKLSTANVYYSDSIQHLTEAGYRRITPAIESWMRTL